MTSKLANANAKPNSQSFSLIVPILSDMKSLNHRLNELAGPTSLT